MTKNLPAARPGLRHVAKRAGVSLMTVSNVVNGKLERVSDEVRERVKLAIKDLNYRPQLRGRSLRLDRDFAVGLIVLHPERRFLDDPFNTEVAAGMSNQLARDGYGLMVFGAQSIEDLANKTPRIAQLDAIAISNFGPRPQRLRDYDAIGRLGLPMLILQDEPAALTPDITFIRQDDAAGGRALAQRLISTGARRMLFMAPTFVWPAIEAREQGIREACVGHAEVETIQCAETDFAEIVASIARRLSASPRPDAVMGCNDMFAIAALQAAGLTGRRVPDDLQITGFNGFSFRHFSTPLVVSVRSAAYEIGEATARRLVLRIEQGAFEPDGILMPVQLLNGTSARPFDQPRV